MSGAFRYNVIESMFQAARINGRKEHQRAAMQCIEVSLHLCLCMHVYVSRLQHQHTAARGMVYLHTHAYDADYS